MSKFYMCYVENGNSPKQTHATLEQAKQEAERLSRINVGKRVYLLQSIASCICDAPEPRWNGDYDKAVAQVNSMLRRLSQDDFNALRHKERRLTDYAPSPPGPKVVS